MGNVDPSQKNTNWLVPGPLRELVFTQLQEHKAKIERQAQALKPLVSKLSTVTSQPSQNHWRQEQDQSVFIQLDEDQTDTALSAMTDLVGMLYRQLQALQDQREGHSSQRSSSRSSSIKHGGLTDNSRNSRSPKAHLHDTSIDERTGENSHPPGSESQHSYLENKACRAPTDKLPSHSGSRSRVSRSSADGSDRSLYKGPRRTSDVNQQMLDVSYRESGLEALSGSDRSIDSRDREDHDPDTRVARDRADEPIHTDGDATTSTQVVNSGPERPPSMATIRTFDDRSRASTSHCDPTLSPIQSSSHSMYRREGVPPGQLERRPAPDDLRAPESSLRSQNPPVTDENSSGGWGWNTSSPPAVHHAFLSRRSYTPPRGSLGPTYQHLGRGNHAHNPQRGLGHHHSHINGDPRYFPRGERYSGAHAGRFHRQTQHYADMTPRQRGQRRSRSWRHPNHPYGRRI